VKVCKHCGQRKKAAKFPRNRRSGDGLSSWYKDCHLEATRRWRAEHREEINQRRRVVPRLLFDPESRTYVPNLDPRRKAKVW
jgi:hypothetical protein